MSIQPYQLEPEYSSSEEIEERSSDSEEEEIGDLNSSSGESRRMIAVQSCRLKWSVSAAKN